MKPYAPMKQVLKLRKYQLCLLLFFAFNSKNLNIVLHFYFGKFMQSPASVTFLCAFNLFF